MQVVDSYDAMQSLVAEVRSLRMGFVTNYYPDPERHSLWIKKGVCYVERGNNTLFIIKISPTFWNVFFCAASIDALFNDLKTFQGLHPEVTKMYDLVGREIQCRAMVELFKSAGCTEASSLIRMTRGGGLLGWSIEKPVRYASQADLPIICRQLHLFFDERTEQIPYDDELTVFVNNHQVLVYEQNNEVIGFLIFEHSATTLYLRYWFVHPDFREKKVGSSLFKRFLEEGKDTKRQILWVVQTNENAIKRYRHYGFTQENMYDFIMQHN